jgi:hypothetical protein
MAELALVVRSASMRQHMEADRTAMCKSLHCEQRHDPMPTAEETTAVPEGGT